MGQHLGDFAGIDAGILGYPHSAEDVLRVEVGVELLHLPGSHQVALHPRGPVAAGPPLQRHHPLPRGGNVHAAAVLHAQVKTLILCNRNKRY